MVVDEDVLDALLDEDDAEDDEDDEEDDGTLIEVEEEEGKDNEEVLVEKAFWLSAGIVLISKMYVSALSTSPSQIFSAS